MPRPQRKAAGKSWQARRESAERYFLTNAGSFIVGWGWVVVLRDLAAVTSDAIDLALDNNRMAFLSEASKHTV